MYRNKKLHEKYTKSLAPAANILRVLKGLCDTLNAKTKEAIQAPALPNGFHEAIKAALVEVQKDGDTVMEDFASTTTSSTLSEKDKTAIIGGVVTRLGGNLKIITDEVTKLSGQTVSAALKEMDKKSLINDIAQKTGISAGFAQTDIAAKLNIDPANKIDTLIRNMSEVLNAVNSIPSKATPAAPQIVRCGSTDLEEHDVVIPQLQALTVPSDKVTMNVHDFYAVGGRDSK